MRICCDGKGGFKVCSNPNAGSYDGMVMECMEEHEEWHISDLMKDPECQSKCEGKKKDQPVTVDKSSSDELECSAYRAELNCLKKKGPWPKAKERMGYVDGRIKSHCKTVPGAPPTKR